MRFDVVVIGGGPAGTVTATTAKRYYPEKRVVLIKGKNDGIVPWGIPYLLTTLRNADEHLIENAFLDTPTVDVIDDDATAIDTEAKIVKTEGHGDVSYDKLVIATGASARQLPIEGIEKLGIYSVRKDKEYLHNLRKDADDAREIVVVGGGFVGIEFAEEFAKLGKKVHVVEADKRILCHNFDQEFSELVERELKSKGVNILTGVSVHAFDGDERVRAVHLEDGNEIGCQLALVSIGEKANSDLAKKAGIALGQRGGIAVDEYLRTSEKDVFAAGDCCEKKDFFTRKPVPIMLASTATSEARLAASSLYQLKIIREYKGTIAIYSTKIGDITLGCAGLTEDRARQEGFEIVVGRAETYSKHPAVLPGTKKVKVKLIFSKQSGLLVGGQISGAESAAEMINMIGLAIEKNTTLGELDTLQIATHPLLTSPPTMYPVIIAAQDALEKLMR